MLVATQDTATQEWERIKGNYERTATISGILLEILNATSQYVTSTPIEFSKESFLKNIDFEDTDPETVLKYIDFEKGYIEDEVTDMGLNYWKDETAAFGWKVRKDEGYTPLGPGKAELVYEIGTGGPNIHLVFFYDLKYPVESEFRHGIDIPEPEFTKSEFQYHWWSPVHIIDTTEDAAAQECLSQIEEEALEMFEKNYEHPTIV